MNSIMTLFADQSISSTVQTVVATLFARIKSEDYGTDERLPSERTLAAELGVARNTVREALDVLETRGFIRRRAGSGSFVTYRTDTSLAPSGSDIASRWTFRLCGASSSRKWSGLQSSTCHLERSTLWV
jgi:DNA-binding GntR family transcriptional regulator